MNRLQSAKDSLYVALRGRLAALDPGRTATIGGVLRPGMALAATLHAPVDEGIAGVFYLGFGKVEAVADSAADELVKVECVVSYRATASAEGLADAEGQLATMDAELMAICRPYSTALMDYTQTPAVGLGDAVFWSAPQMGETKAADGYLAREAKLTLFVAGVLG